MGVIVLAMIGFATAYISWRLLRHHASANGVTVMPTWFIQLFGILFFVGLCLVAYQRRSAVLVLDGLFVALAMIFVGRNVAKRKASRSA